MRDTCVCARVGAWARACCVGVCVVRRYALMCGRMPFADEDVCDTSAALDDDADTERLESSRGMVATGGVSLPPAVARMAAAAPRAVPGAVPAPVLGSPPAVSVAAAGEQISRTPVSVSALAAIASTPRLGE